MDLSSVSHTIIASTLDSRRYAIGSHAIQDSDHLRMRNLHQYIPIMLTHSVYDNVTSQTNL
jgi:hypothetical protein